MTANVRVTKILTMDIGPVLTAVRAVLGITVPSVITNAVAIWKMQIHAMMGCLETESASVK